MGVYDQEREMALEMIAEFGESCSWLQTPVAVIDPVKPWVETPSTPARYDGVKIAFFPAGTNDLKTLQLKLKTEVPANTEIGYMGSVPFEPGLSDFVVKSDGAKWRIISSGVINPNGEGAVLYQLAVTR